MKKTIKVMAAIMLVAAMVLGIASCGGFDLNKVKGEWTLSTIDGKAASDKAVELGLPSYALLNNYSIGDKVAISTYDPNAGEVKTTTELSIEAAANGFTATDSNGGKVSFIYDSSADTLSYSAVGASGANETYILKRGTTDILAAVQAAAGGEEAAEGGEEYSEEDYSEEEEYAAE